MTANRLIIHVCVSKYHIHRLFHLFIGFFLAFGAMGCHTHVAQDDADDLTRLIDSVYLRNYYSPEYYVIVGSLKDSSGAVTYARRVAADGLSTEILHSDKRWRVAAACFDIHREAIRFRNRYNSKNPGAGAWILEMVSVAGH